MKPGSFLFLVFSGSKRFPFFFDDIFVEEGVVEQSSKLLTLPVLEKVFILLSRVEPRVVNFQLIENSVGQTQTGALW